MSHKAKRAKTEAHLVAPEEARAAASAVGPACTILELVERFEQSKYFDGKGTVDANKLVNGFNLHLEESGLRPPGGEEMPLGHGIVNVLIRDTRAFARVGLGRIEPDLNSQRVRQKEE